MLTWCHSMHLNVQAGYASIASLRMNTHFDCLHLLVWCPANSALLYNYADARLLRTAPLRSI